MIHSINPFLNFNGNAADALALYQSALGANVVEKMTWRDLPNEDVPPEVADHIMYARLEIGGGAVELSDVPPGMSVSPGSNCHVAIHSTDPKELDKMFAALMEGGEVEMPLENMFWGARYGKLRDRFGISWTFNCPLDS